MKLEINEVYFLNEVVKAANIKAADAPTICDLMIKLEKEFLRLQKLEEKKA
tara:strand:- start:2091 stop:2243 length:153 start_codon:yes stop_codon:yes gene_type:complete